VCLFKKLSFPSTRSFVVCLPPHFHWLVRKYRVPHSVKVDQTWSSKNTKVFQKSLQNYVYQLLTFTDKVAVAWNFMMYINLWNLKLACYHLSKKIFSSNYGNAVDYFHVNRMTSFLKFYQLCCLKTFFGFLRYLLNPIWREKSSNK
jgi:hypothetical protein